MVQSIWLNIDKQTMIFNKPEIIRIIKSCYKTCNYVDDIDGMLNKITFEFLDCNQHKKILEKIGLKINDSKFCDCGCYSTDFELVMKFISLELNYGKFNDQIDIEFYRIGRNVWGSVGMYTERLNLLRYILEDIQKELKKHNIPSEMDFSDCEDCFVDYFKTSGGKKC
jgi:hypothetical protein